MYLTLIVQGLNAILAAAKYAPQVVAAVKQLIDTFTFMTAEQQNAYKAKIDADAVLALAGIPPNPAWTVEPDPGPVAPPVPPAPPTP